MSERISSPGSEGLPRREIGQFPEQHGAPSIESIVVAPKDLESAVLNARKSVELALSLDPNRADQIPEIAEVTGEMTQETWQDRHNEFARELSERTKDAEAATADLNKKYSIPESVISYTAGLLDFVPLEPVIRSVVSIKDAFSEARQHGIGAGINRLWRSTKEAFGNWGKRIKKFWGAHTLDVMEKRHNITASYDQGYTDTVNEFSERYPNFNPFMSPERSAFIDQAVVGDVVKSQESKSKFENSKGLNKIKPGLSWLWYDLLADQSRKNAEVLYDKKHPKEKVKSSFF